MADGAEVGGHRRCGGLGVLVGHGVQDRSVLAQLLKITPPSLGRTARLAKAADVADLRRIAKRRTPTAAFDYVDGAAQREVTARRAREVFDSVELLPRILHGVAEPTATAGSSCTSGRTATAPATSSSALRRPATPPCWSRWTPPWRASACGTSATA